MSTDIELRPARPDDLEAVEALLANNDLPVADVPDAIDVLLICETTGGQVGVGGLQQCGDAALLRSVAVAASARGNGYATALCEELLERARSAGVTDVYLLTTTASAFFERRGFREVARETVPQPVRETGEFEELCPSTAVVMRRGLE